VRGIHRGGVHGPIRDALRRCRRTTRWRRSSSAADEQRGCSESRLRRAGRRRSCARAACMNAPYLYSVRTCKASCWPQAHAAGGGASSSQHATLRTRPFPNPTRAAALPAPPQRPRAACAAPAPRARLEQRAAAARPSAPPPRATAALLAAVAAGSSGGQHGVLYGGPGRRAHQHERHQARQRTLCACYHARLHARDATLSGAERALCPWCVCLHACRAARACARDAARNELLDALDAVRARLRRACGAAPNTSVTQSQC
jgi:hypothetical protein